MSLPGLDAGGVFSYIYELGMEPGSAVYAAGDVFAGVEVEGGVSACAD